GGVFAVFVKKIFWFWLPCFFAHRITVISNFTKSQLIEMLPWASKKISVIPNCVNPKIKSVKASFNQECPTVLHLGTKENKNLENTILGLKNIRCELVIVGRLSTLQKSLLEEVDLSYRNLISLSFDEI